MGGVTSDELSVAKMRQMGITAVRIFFIVVAAVLFARFVEASLKHLAKRLDRMFDPEIEKLRGMTKEEYDFKVAREHPYRALLIPFFWLAVVIVGFLWAILSR